MSEKENKPWDESNVRMAVYHACGKQLGLSPLHGRDAIICPHCRQPVVPFESGRPDLLVMNRYGYQAVIEVKIIRQHLNEISFAFANHKENQIKWLNWWTTVTEEETMFHYQPLGFLAIGTSVDRDIWVIEWKAWNELIVGPATTLGRKSVSITTLDAKMDAYKMLKVKGGYAFKAEHPMWGLLSDISLFYKVNGEKKEE